MAVTQNGGTTINSGGGGGGGIGNGQHSNDTAAADVAMTTSARSTFYSLQREFDCEAASNNNGDGPINNNMVSYDDDDDEFDRLPIPPPPRDDILSDDSDVDEEEDSLMEDHHLRHHGGNNTNRNDGHPSINGEEGSSVRLETTLSALGDTLDGSALDGDTLDNDNDSSGDGSGDDDVDDNDDDNGRNDSNDTTCSFGDETMHVLMDADLRLSSVPPTPNSSGKGGDGGSQGGHGLVMPADRIESSLHLQRGVANSYERSSFEVAGVAGGEASSKSRGGHNEENVGGMANRTIRSLHIERGTNFGNTINNNNNDESYEDDGLSAGFSAAMGTVASLLRGPIMAAKSASRAMNTKGYTEQEQRAGVNDTESGGMGNRGVEVSRNDLPAEDALRRNHVQSTPSAARGEFVMSAQKFPSRTGSEFGHAMMANGVVMGSPEMMVATPSTARNGFLPSVQTVPRPPSSAQSSDELSPSGLATVMTPSAARSGMLASAQKEATTMQQQYWANNTGGGETPSQLRNEFIVSTQKPNGRQRPPLTRYIQSGNQQEQQHTPSSERDHFLTSPQDSVSTMGIRSPSDGYVVVNSAGIPVGIHSPSEGYNAFGGMMQHQQRGMLQQQMMDNAGHPTPSVERSKFVTSPQQQQNTLNVLVNNNPNNSSLVYQDPSPLSAANFPTETPLSNGSNPSRGGGSGQSPILEMSDQFIDSMNQNHKLLHTGERGGTLGKSGMGSSNMMNTNSLENMIALGEEQMRKSSTAAAASDTPNNMSAGNTTKNVNSLENMIALGEEQMAIAAAENAAAAANNNHPSLPPKKPFLRKGTRREPSALHKVNTQTNSATPSTQQKSNVSSARPSTAQQFNGNEATSTTPSSTQRNSNGRNSTPTESLSDKQARMARLERMQEDLRKDWEQRQVRKEEARKDRSKAKKSVAATPAAAKMAKAAMTRNAGATPSQVRPSSVRRATNRGARDEQTPSKARSQSVTKARVDSRGAMEESPWNARQNHEATSSQARPSSVRRSRGAEAEEQTPSNARRSAKEETPSHARHSTEQRTPSQVREARSATKKLSSKALTTEEDHMPSRARSYSVTETLSPSSVDNIVDWYMGDCEEEMADACVEGNGMVQKEVAKAESKPKSAKKVRPNSTPRPRTSMARSSNAAKRRSGKQNISTSSADDKKELEEWKKKEEEQWALIKNMRRRQEVALREAEGERERAKAWAASEKESVQKWITEQRKLIKKERHKAANAALLASKKASREKREEEGKDEEFEDMKAELENVRSRMKRMKAKENEEMRRLKEVIRRQERTINALKSSDNGAGGNGAVALSKNGKSPNGGAPVTQRQALGDCSSKDNTQKQQHQSDYKPKSRRKSSSEDVPKNKKEETVEGAMPAVRGEEQAAQVGSLTEEPTEHWLQDHLSKLKNANEELGAKMMDEQGRHTHELSDDSNHVAEDMHANVHADPLHVNGQQRKPYNAADYGGKEENNYPTQSLSRPNVPPFVTAPSLSMHDAEVNESCPQQTPTKSQIFTYKNGTQKEVLADGTTTVSFANGDRKRTYCGDKRGITVYYYAATKTTQVTHQDGMQTYHFPNKQIENHYTDGRKEITFPDGTTRMVHTDGSCDTTFADGVRVIDFPDGMQRVIQA